jgi:very-short-patch-repair endonuclease
MSEFVGPDEIREMETCARSKAKSRKEAKPKLPKPTGFEEDVHGGRRALASLITKNDAVHKDRESLIFKQGMILAARKATDQFEDTFNDLAAMCESPIERIFLATAMAHAQTDVELFFPYPTYYANGVESIETEKFDDYLYEMMGPHGPTLIAVMVQFPIDKYRVDFLLYGINAGCGDRDEWMRVKVVIECDGHDHHEKTKEQAKRDKARDRRLTKLGYRVMRFTGSELWNDPRKCVAEAHEFISDLQHQHYLESMRRRMRSMS